MNLKRFPRSILLKVVCFAIGATCSVAVCAQSMTYLQGTVKAPPGNLIPGVTIVLTNSSNGGRRSTVNRGNGTYEIPFVSPGTYDVAAERAQFAKVEIRNQELLVNKTKTLNFTMANSIRVEVNLVDATAGNPMSLSQIESLPAEDRSPAALAGLQPGVVQTGITDRNYPDTRDGSVAGGRSDQNNHTLDGVDGNNRQTGKAFESTLPITQDSIQELRVVTVNGNSDSGRSSGAGVPPVTRSGENEFHGSVYEYQDSDVTSANNFFSNSTVDPVTRKTLERPKFNRNILSCSFGGPILKEKVFFFVNIEDSITRREEPQLRLVPSHESRRLG